MFSFVAKEDYVAIRLPEDDREAFIKNHNSELAVSHGTVMKEYVVVPEKLLGETGLMAKFLKKSQEYIKSLKPKPAKKKS